MKYCVTIQRYQRIFMIQKVLSIPMNLSALSIKQCSSHDCTPINQCSYRSISGTDTSEITPKMLVPVQRLDRYGHWLTGGVCRKTHRKCLILSTLQNEYPQTLSFSRGSADS